MLQTIERYMKQAIVDKNPSVASAALVSSLHMSKTAGDVVKRWVNEAQEALNSDKYEFQSFIHPKTSIGTKLLYRFWHLKAS